MRRFLPVLALAVLFTPAGCDHDGESRSSPQAPSVAAVEEIALPAVGPFGAALTPDGTRLFVPLFGDYVAGAGNQVAILDAKTHALLATVPSGARPEDVAFSEDGAFAYVTNSDSATVTVIDVGSSEVAATISVGTPFDPDTWVGTYPYGITVHKKRGYVFSAGNSDGSDRNITILDLDPAGSTFHQVIGGIELSGSFTRGVIRPGTDELIVPRGAPGNDYSASPEIAIIDTATNALVASIPILQAEGGFHGIEDIAVTPNGKYAYVPFFHFDSGEAEVFVIDLENRSFRDVVGLGTGDIAAHGIATTPDGILVGVTSWNKGVVSWIFTPTNTVVLEHTVGANPNEIALTPDGRKAFVTNQNGQSVHAIPLPPSHELIADLVTKAKKTSEAAADLDWRVQQMSQSAQSGDAAVLRVWIDNLAQRIRYWAELGAVQIGQPKNPASPGAVRNGFEVQKGGIVAGVN